ncbi:prepilin-type N-terminal cleavage/methylation domain-containing protein [Candidatus Wolfebacteria bacterium]|nr:prepilin-type N-terminal cleavage/methylation domain-containing protein [Candidatus Wolfebacteria bacterium]
MRDKKYRGFTLLEFLIVIGITVILGTIAGLNLYGIYTHRNLNSDIQKIVYVLRAARDNSINQEQASQWGVHFENPATSTDFYVLFRGSDYSTGTSSLRETLGLGVEFTSPSSGSSTDVIFSKLTGLSSTASPIIISLTNNPTASGTISITTSTIQY